MATMEHAVVSTEAGNPELLAQKRAEITDKLQKREDERLEKVQKRKDERDNAVAVNETTQFFLQNFSSAKTEVENKLSSSDSLDKSQMAGHFDALLVLVQKMQKYFTDSTIFLQAYDIQKAQETIGKLQAAIHEKRELLIPKKKFGFKGKTKTDKAAKTPAVEVVKKDIKVAISECNFADVEDKTLIKTAEEVNNQDVALARLTNCIVKFYGSPGAVHINELKNCNVFSGPVSGSIFIDQCVNCKFIMPCQQMRIHSTTDSEFYIHVTSKAIIEDCQKVQFAPYNWRYPDIEEHYKISGLDKSRNNWDDVDDFNWLASDSHSPNWSELPEANRTKEWEI